VRTLDNPAIFCSSPGQVCPCTLAPQVCGHISLAEAGTVAERGGPATPVTLPTAVLTPSCAGVTVLPWCPEVVHFRVRLAHTAFCKLKGVSKKQSEAIVCPEA